MRDRGEWREAVQAFRTGSVSRVSDDTVGQWSFKKQSSEEDALEDAPKLAILAPYQNAFIGKTDIFNRIEERQVTGVDTLITDSFSPQPKCIGSEYH